MQVNKNAGEINDSQSVQNSSNGTSAKSEALTEYSSQTYGFMLKFPGQWHMNNDHSEDKFKKETTDDGQKLTTGGQTFWSNYPDINKYNPGNRPADFHILALTVYKDETPNLTIENFAAKIGIDADAPKDTFSADGTNGTEFISPGTDSQNPRVIIIFNKGALFYVFNLAFIGGDKNAAAQMEQIVATFRLN